MVLFNLLSLLLLLVFVLVLACFAKSTTDVSYCEPKKDYDMKVKRFEISPTPVARGQPATFSISATTNNTINGGKLVIEVSYFGWHVHSETHDLCAETSCPVAEGDFALAHSLVLPGYTPPESFVLDATAISLLGITIFCHWPCNLRPERSDANYWKFQKSHVIRSRDQDLVRKVLNWIT